MRPGWSDMVARLAPPPRAVPPLLRLVQWLNGQGFQSGCALVSSYLVLAWLTSLSDYIEDEGNTSLVLCCSFPFLLMGLGMIYGGLLMGNRNVRLLRRGQWAEGQLVIGHASGKRGPRRPHQSSAPSAPEHEHTANVDTTRSEPVAGPLEPLLDELKSHDRASPMSLLPGPVQVDASGRLREVPFTTLLKLLVLPVLTLALFGSYLLWWFA